MREQEWADQQRQLEAERQEAGGERRLIEDYLPIQAISAEASHERSVRKGHNLDAAPLVGSRNGDGGAETHPQILLRRRKLKVGLTLRQEARERRIATNLKPFVGDPAGNQSRPVEPDQQPEASLARWVGDHPREA